MLITRIRPRLQTLINWKWSKAPRMKMWKAGCRSWPQKPTCARRWRKPSTLKDGSKLEGYCFDRRTGASLADSFVRLIPKDSPRKVAIAYSQIAGLAFSGRDTAAGRSWEAWVRKYWEKRAAGEKDIGLEPEKLE